MTPGLDPEFRNPYWTGIPPIEDVLAWRSQDDRTPRIAHSDHTDHYLTEATPCPDCGKSASDLEWFWFESPDWTWKSFCGRAGWMSFCPDDECIVNFFVEALN